MSKAANRAREIAGIGNRVAPLRFLVFLAVLVAGYPSYRAMLPVQGWRDVAAMAFDLAALVFLVSLVPLLRESSTATMRRHSRDNDANRLLILIVTSLLTLVAMAALTGEMPGARHGDLAAIAKLVGTMLLIWLFANSVYALHYAHAYYAREPKSGGDAAGIDFPGTKTPDYWDFAYFAYTLGMTFQTSDVAITAPAIRKVALLHCFAAFIFNIGVIAFTINVLGGSGG